MNTSAIPRGKDSDIPSDPAVREALSWTQSARFLTTASLLSQLPGSDLPEVAFVGRSNAGKSTAINTLAQHRRLAFASKTPGRTQHINLFDLGPMGAPDGRWADLPGYGYAAVPAAARAHWHELVGGYLRTRACLRGVILIMDVRHPLTELDRQLLDWLRPTGVPVHVLLSKSDKLGHQQAGTTLRETNAALARYYVNCSAQLFSSTHKVGIVEAAKQIQRWLGDARNKEPPVKGD